jgi:prevent-host-death family protein
MKILDRLPSFGSRDLRLDTRRVMDAVTHDNAHAVITRHGEPGAVLVPVDWYERAHHLMCQADADGA